MNRFEIGMVAVIVLFTAFFSCKKDEPCLTCPPPAHTLSLDTVLVDPTEVWLKLSTTDITTFADTIRIIRDDTVTVFNARLLAADTVVTNTRLLPGHLYQYRAYRLQHSVAVDFSAPLLVRTMDTSNHNFHFDVESLGEFGSQLYDVAIVNDTLVYAVGELYTLDSTGVFDYEPYGLAIWNGRTWQWKHLYAPGPTPGSYVSIIIPRGVLAFSPTDVWFAGGGVFHWNGQSDTVTSYWINPFPGNPSPILDPGQRAMKLWGTSSADVCAVATAGGIARYDGVRWHKLSSGTTLDIEDIYGGINPRTGQQEVLAIASRSLDNSKQKILRIDGTTVTAISDSGIGISTTTISGVWFDPGRRYYLSGDGIFTTRTINGPSTKWTRDIYGSITGHFRWAIRGTGINDVVTVGEDGACLHFDGYRWTNFFPQTYLANGDYRAVAIKGRLIVAVGVDYGNERGVVAIGKR